MLCLSFNEKGKLTKEAFKNYLDSTEYKNLSDTDKAKLTIRGDVQTIGEKALSGFSKLEEIELPSSLQRICAESFSECSSLHNITIPNSIC